VEITIVPGIEFSYFGFLATFLVPPIIVFALLAWRDESRGQLLMPTMRGLIPYPLIGLLVIIAVVWTTPWDNYLVATNVWWYRDDLVTGILIGWVPIEEYCFFVLQPIMSGLFAVWLMRRLPAPQKVAPSKALRTGVTAVVFLIMIASWIALLFGPPQATYLGLELVWALPPIALQTAFGADILWRHRWLVFTAIGVPTLYLAAADALAILGGTWTIDPEQSFVGLKLFGILPLEEFIFFLLTNILVVFGLVLGCATASQERLPAAFRSWINQAGGARPTGKEAPPAS
jgi:lycopene cyclase domain-containing protein